jgi:DNA-binding NarL/FixJ family response regulator
MAAVALVTDLIFATKILSTAKSVGINLSTVRTTDALRAKLDDNVRLALIDMNAEGVDPAGAIEAAKAAPSSPHVLAYLSHVQTDLAEAARRAGADEVLPRSKFSADLPAILQQYA